MLITHNMLMLLDMIFITNRMCHVHSLANLSQYIFVAFKCAHMKTKNKFMNLCWDNSYLHAVVLNIASLKHGFQAYSTTRKNNQSWLRALKYTVVWWTDNAYWLNFPAVPEPFLIILHELMRKKMPQNKQYISYHILYIYACYMSYHSEHIIG